MISLSRTLGVSSYLVRPFNAGIDGPYMTCDRFTSPSVTGQFRIRSFLTTLRNLSFAMWFVLLCRTIDSSAFLTSLALNMPLFESTVDRKLNALLSLDTLMLLASSAYNLSETRLNFNTCPSDMCTINAFSTHESIVTRKSFVMRASDKMFARLVLQNQTSMDPKFAFVLVSREPPLECILNISPSVVCRTFDTNFSLQNRCSIDSLSKRIQSGLT